MHLSPRACRGAATGFMCIALSACAGGGVVLPSARSLVPIGGAVWGTIAIDVPRTIPAAPERRKVAYISPGTTGAAVFIDGSATPAGSTTTCAASVSSGAGCTLTWTAALTAPAIHTFAVEIDNGTTVLAENKASYALHAGNNGALTVLTLNGVASVGATSGETCTTASCSGTLTVADAAADPIVNTTSVVAPGFDNGPLTFASTNGVGTVTAPAGGTVTQPPASGTLAYAVTCAGTGSFFTTLAPNSTAGSGDITSAELTNRSLTYPAAITFGKTYSCTAGTIGNALYVGTTATPTGSIRIYTSTGAATAQATITGANTALNAPQGVAVDASGRVYAANEGANSITVYAPNASGTMNETPVATITGGNTGMNVSQGVALDASGRIYVANNGASSVTVYAANPSGIMNEAPLATIGGATTTLNNPVGVALDTSGYIYVANATGNDIVVFPPNPSGTLNEVPTATISGSNTLISNPNGVAIDATGRIYVANYGSNTVTVYAAHANGNVTPVSTIGGGTTGISHPTGVALDASGRIYVANNAASTVTLYAANPTGSVTSAPIASVTGVTAVWGLTLH